MQRPRNLQLYVSVAPPSVNASYGPTPDGKRIYAKPVLKKWKKLAAQELGLQLIAAKLTAPVFPGAVRIWVTLPENRRRDGDNALKATLDALKAAGVIVDDRAAYVRSVTAEWDDIDRVVINIEETAFAVFQSTPQQTSYGDKDQGSAVNTPKPRRKVQVVGALDWAQKQLARRGIKVDKERIHL